MTKELLNLGDILVFQQKSDKKAGDGLSTGRFPFFTSSNKQNLFINDSKYNGHSLIFGTGGNASIHYCDTPFSASADCIVVNPENPDELNIKFIYYYLSSKIYILEAGFRGAGLKHISKSYIQNIPIPIPDKRKQDKIVAILDKADAIRQKRQKAIELADEFLRSVFWDMFGSNAAGFSEWDRIKVIDLVAPGKNKIRTGPFGSDLRHSEFVDQGVCVIGIDNAVKNKFEWAERRFITPEKYNELKRYRVYPGDVIITIMGTTGRTSVIPDDIPLSISTKHLAVITVNKEIIEPEYLSNCFFRHPEVITQIRRSNKGAIMHGLNLGIIKNLPIPIPPLKKQQQFTSVLRKVEKLKDKFEVLNDESRVLFGSLTQRAFRGDL